MVGLVLSMYGLWMAVAQLPIVVFSLFFNLDRAIFASSFLTFSASFGRMVATGLTGFFNQMGGYSLAFNLATSIGIMAMMVVIFSREKKRPPKKPSLRSIGQLFMRRDVLLP